MPTESELVFLDVAKIGIIRDRKERQTRKFFKKIKEHFKIPAKTSYITADQYLKYVNEFENASVTIEHLKRKLNIK